MGKVTALIPCAGQGKRMGGSVSKPFLEIYQHPLLKYTLDKFQKNSLVDQIVLISQTYEIEYYQKYIVDKYGFSKVKAIVAGGRERQESVQCGISVLDKDTEWVIIHDGVRPLIASGTLTKAIKMAFEKGCVVVGVPAKDTIKKVNLESIIEETPPRHTLWHVQTPQIFRRNIIERAYIEAARRGWQGTDDSYLVEMMGEKVYMLRGDYTNIKVTTPEDLLYVREFLRMDRS